MDRGRGQINPSAPPSAATRGGFAGRLAGPTSDVKNAVVAPDTPGNQTDAFCGEQRLRDQRSDRTSRRDHHMGSPFLS